MIFRTFSALSSIDSCVQGRRASLRSALAPGYHIQRLWRCPDFLRPFIIAVRP